MTTTHQAGDAPLAPATLRLAFVGAASLLFSVGLMVLVGLCGRSVVVPRFLSAAPWPPYFVSVRLSDPAVTGLAWLAVGTGGLGLVAALLAARRGWRPRPRALLIGCLLAVLALMLVPPMGSTDMLDYAMYGRMATLGHSPYLMTPAQLAATGDPVARYGPISWRNAYSVYGPLGTFSEQAASYLAGPSMAKTLFWLKVWNALAFLAVALALDRLLRSEPAARVRAHLLWSVNPLMLWAVLAGGHIDGLAMAAGFLGLLCVRRLGAARGLAAGLLIGAAVAIKAPFALFLLGPVWVARRSLRTLAAVAVGAVAVVLPCYLLAGRAAVTAVISRGTGVADLYQPWQLLTRALGLHDAVTFTNAAGLGAAAVLALVLLWRLPPGPASPAGLVFVRPVLAVSLAWLVCTPQQRPWYDAMIFPLLALMPATRLDWIVIFRAMAATVAELPDARGFREFHLGSLTVWTVSEAVPAILAVLTAALVWLCVTGRWGPGGRAGRAAGGQRPWPDLAPSGSLHR
jgi:Glycosyltransferase family 87